MPTTLAGRQATREVGPGKAYATLQAAINAANSGDSILIAPDYTHNGTRVTVDDTMTIDGQGATINGGLDVTSGANVNISNLSISGITGESGASWSAQSSPGTTGEKIVVSVLDGGKLTTENFNINQTGLVDANLVAFNLNSGAVATIRSGNVTLVGGNVFGFYLQNGTVSVSIDDVDFNFTPQRQRTGFNNQNGVIFGTQVGANSAWPTISARDYTLGFTSTAGPGVEQRPYKLQAIYSGATGQTRTQVLSWVASKMAVGEQARVYVSPDADWINEYVPPVTNVSSNTLYPTIQTAINAASSSDTIQVAPGTYNENVSITKRINLLGPYADVSPWEYGVTDDTPSQWGAPATWATIKGSAGAATRAIDIAGGLNGVVIKGLAIDGSSSQWGVYAYRSRNVTIQNNFITASNDTAVITHGTSDDTLQDWTVDSNLIVGDLTPTTASGVNFQGPVHGLTFTGNKVVKVGRGVQFSRGGLGVVGLAGNEFKDIALRGVQLAGVWASGTSVSITGNDFINVNNEGPNPTNPIVGASGSGMIRFSELLVLPSDSTVTIENNSLQQSTAASVGTAITFLAPTTADTTVPFERVTIRDNRFALPAGAKRIAIYAPAGQPAKTLVAEKNLWGPGLTTEPAISASIWYADVDSQNVTADVNPWVLNYTDDPAKAGQPGFWPIVQKAEADTPIGTNVDDTFTGFPNSGQVKLTFAQVDDTGLTTVTAFQGDDSTPFPTVPSGFTLGTPPVFYTITSDAKRAVGSTIRVCLTFPAGSFAPGVSPIMYHFTGGAWVALDTTVVGSTACASVTSFSPFALGVPLPPPPPPAPTFAPSAPRELAGAAGDARITATWAAPADSGSFPVTSYQVETVPGGASCLVAAPALTCTITGLTNGTAYTLRARALNGAGWSEWSEPSAPVTPGAGTPSAPTNVVAVAGNAEAVITWTAPAQAGDSAITGYRIEQSRAGGEWTAAVANTGSTETIATVTSLVNGDSYRFRVAAINASGIGPASQPSPAVTPEDPEGVTILITGERTTVNGKSGIQVTGETIGLAEGAVLRPWLRFPGQSAFARGGARILVGADGEFTWQRKTGKGVTVYIQAGDGTRSNRVVIPAR